MSAILHAGGDDTGAFTVLGFCSAYQISRSLTYKEIAAGRLRIMKAGTRTLISRRAAREWERECEAAAEDPIPA